MNITQTCKVLRRGLKSLSSLSIPIKRGKTSFPQPTKHLMYRMSLNWTQFWRVNRILNNLTSMCMYSMPCSWQLSLHFSYIILSLLNSNRTFLSCSATLAFLSLLALAPWAVPLGGWITKWHLVNSQNDYEGLAGRNY